MHNVILQSVTKPKTLLLNYLLHQFIFHSQNNMQTKFSYICLNNFCIWSKFICNLIMAILYRRITYILIEFSSVYFNRKIYSLYYGNPHHKAVWDFPKVVLILLFQKSEEILIFSENGDRLTWRCLFEIKYLKYDVETTVLISIILRASNYLELFFFFNFWLWH